VPISTAGRDVAGRATVVVDGTAAPLGQNGVRPSLETLAPRRGFGVAASCTHAPSAMPRGSAAERGGRVPAIGPSLLVEISAALPLEDRDWLCTAAYITSDEIPVVLLLDGVTINDVYHVLSGPVMSFGCVRFGVRFQPFSDREWAEVLAKNARLVVVSSENGACAAKQSGGWPVLAADLRALAVRRGASNVTSLLTLFGGCSAGA
jgi:hypothetical protein